MELETKNGEKGLYTIIAINNCLNMANQYVVTHMILFLIEVQFWSEEARVGMQRWALSRPNINKIIAKLMRQIGGF